MLMIVNDMLIKMRIVYSKDESEQVERYSCKDSFRETSPQQHTIKNGNNLQTEDDPTQAGREHNLDGPPAFARETVEIICERDAGQKIRKEYVDRTRYDQLVEDLPIRDIATTEIPEIFLQKTEGLDRTRNMHNA